MARKSSAAAANGLERLETARFNWEYLLKQPVVANEAVTIDPEGIKVRIAATKSEFIAGMEDDFNTPQALASIYELVREVNRWVQDKEFQLTTPNKALLAEALATFMELGAILGLVSTAQPESSASFGQEIEALIQERTHAKPED